MAAEKIVMVVLDASRALAGGSSSPRRSRFEPGGTWHSPRANQFAKPRHRFAGENSTQEQSVRAKLARAAAREATASLQQRCFSSVTSAASLLQALDARHDQVPSNAPASVDAAGQQPHHSRRPQSARCMRRLFSACACAECLRSQREGASTRFARVDQQQQQQRKPPQTPAFEDSDVATAAVPAAPSPPRRHWRRAPQPPPPSWAEALMSAPLPREYFASARAAAAALPQPTPSATATTAAAPPHANACSASWLLHVHPTRRSAPQAAAASKAAATSKAAARVALVSARPPPHRAPPSLQQNHPPPPPHRPPPMPRGQHVAPAWTDSLEVRVPADDQPAAGYATRAGATRADATRVDTLAKRREGATSPSGRGGGVSLAPAGLVESDRVVVGEALEAFEGRHNQRRSQAARALRASSRFPSGARSHLQCSRATNEVRRNRAFVVLPLPPPPVAIARVKKVEEEAAGEVQIPRWSLERSIWSGRPTISESRDYHDTDRLLRAAIHTDYRKVRRPYAVLCCMRLHPPPHLLTYSHLLLPSPPHFLISSIPLTPSTLLASSTTSPNHR